MENNLKISLIGVPTNSSGKVNGVAKAPSVLRKVGLVDTLSQYCDVFDEGDITFLDLDTQRDKENHIIGYDSLVSMIHSVKNTVKSSFQRNRFPLVIGGDCPLLLGCLAAMKDTYRNSGLFFIDGHEDAYSPIQSPTGEAADMELGFALGMNTDGIRQDLSYMLPLIEKENICMLGPRDKYDIQRFGATLLKEKIPSYDDHFIENQNVDAMIEHEVIRIGSKVDRWWLHVDLDVLSSEEFPAVDYLQPGGISWNNLEYLSLRFIVKNSCAGWNVTIYNPDRDPTLKYAKRIVNYFGNVLSSINDM